jgi:hypothetical protein
MRKASTTRAASKLRRNRQIYELHLQADISDVGHPKLIETGQYHALDQVRVYRQPVLGVGGQNELSPPQTEQVVRAQQPQDALMIHAPTLPPQFSMHAAVAVRWPAQRDLLDLGA